MTATTRANLPALVRRQWDRESDCFHALAWAEWLEEHGQPDRGELVRLLHEGRHALDCDCTRCRRSRELRMRLSAWKCPECWGKGIVRLADFPPVNYRSVREAMVATPSFTIREEDCARCRGTGDSLTDRNGDAWFQYPLTWDCGYPRWVTLPTPLDQVIWRSMDENSVYHWRCIDRLRALAQTPPWGVPLDGVRVGDVEASPSSDRPGMWYWVKDNPASLCSLPGPVFDVVDGEHTHGRLELKYHPTKQAAADALARGLVKFARGYER